MIVDSALIDIDFGVTIPASNNARLSEVNAGFFTGIKNQGQLQIFFEQSLKTNRKTDKLLKAENNWYDPGKNYVRITTTRDGVAKISMRDVLATQPAFKGKNSGNFHLIFKGEEYPFAFINDDNTIADDNDEIIFLGKRAAGDTTWFDTYTNEAVFYLTYDESAEGNFLKQFATVPATEQNVDVIIHQHIELDREYHWGDSVGYDHNTEPVFGEGFYWQPVDTAAPVVVSFDYYPTQNPQDSVLIAAKFHTTINSDGAKLRLFVNGKGGETILAGSVKDDFVMAKLSSKDIIIRKNQIKIESYDHINRIWID